MMCSIRGIFDLRSGGSFRPKAGDEIFAIPVNNDYYRDDRDGGCQPIKKHGAQEARAKTFTTSRAGA